METVKDWYVILVELTDSTGTYKGERAEAQEDIKTLLFYFEQAHGKKFCALRGGDGAVLLMDGKTDVLNTLGMIREFVHHPCTIGVGQGDIIIKNQDLGPNGMDGGAFHTAAESLKRAKEWVIRGMPPRIFFPKDTFFERRLNA